MQGEGTSVSLSSEQIFLKLAKRGTQQCGTTQEHGGPGRSIQEGPALVFLFHGLCSAGGGQGTRRLVSSLPLPTAGWVLAAFSGCSTELYCEPPLKTRCPLEGLNLDVDVLFRLEQRLALASVTRQKGAFSRFSSGI